MGTGHNQKIDFDSKGFIAVSDSVHLLSRLRFNTIFVDEAHHPLPSNMPKCEQLFQFSATHQVEPQFRYTMGRAIEDGILCDYDITVPAVSQHHVYLCLGNLLLKQAGRFRRVLAYCNTVVEAKRFRTALQELGLAAWHINSKTPMKTRQADMEMFAGELHKPVHVLVTVEILGEGINIPNADTCMFVEPRQSYRSIVQAIGRVLRHHPVKTLAHIIMPAVVLQNRKPVQDAPGGLQEKSETAVSNKSDEHHTDVIDVKGTGSQTTAPAQPAEGEEQSRNMAQTAQVQSKLEELHSKNSSKNPSIPADANSRSLHLETDEGQGKPSHNSRVLLPSKQFGYNGSAETLGDASSGVNDLDEALPPVSPSNGHPDAGALSNTSDTSANFSKWPAKRSHLINPRKSEIQPLFVQNIRYKPRARMRFKSTKRLLFSNQEHDNQLERFLAALVQADERLIAGPARHRIQFLDCSLRLDGELGLAAVMEESYSRLEEILSQVDLWESSLGKVEAFAEEHGRIPRRHSNDLFESKLGTWLSNQGSRMKRQFLSSQKVQRLLNSSSSLISDRVEMWMAGGQKGLFQLKCQKLKEFIEMHHRLPQVRRGQTESPEGKLASWLAVLRYHGACAKPLRRKMLKELHPLMEKLVKKWMKNPPEIDKAKWEDRLRQLESFVKFHRRIPKLKEGGLHSWFHRQRRFHADGLLPLELELQLLCSHPVIVEAVKKNKNDNSITAVHPWARGGTDLIDGMLG